MIQNQTTNLSQEFLFPLRQLYFYLTEGCNLKCRHCWLAPKFESDQKKYNKLDLDLFRKIILEARPLGLSGVKLTGGEPLMHEKVIDLIEFLNSEKLQITIETNGILLTPNIAEKLAQTEKPLISISLDGMDAPTHEWVRGVPGCFEAAVNGARELIRVGLKPQLIMSIMRQTREQMEKFVRFAENLGAGSVKFNVVMPIERGLQLNESCECLSIQELIETGRWAENKLVPDAKIRVIYHHPAAFKPLSGLFGEKSDGCGCCGIKGILGVLSDGSYALCGIGTSVPEMVFGLAGKDSLEKIWRENPVLKKIRQDIPSGLEGICGNCVMSKVCLGSCIAQNFYSTKKLTAPFWYCTEAEKSGLFPKTRLKELSKGNNG
ncbi:MAG: SynChlorMet cassette radical SAM/SPASM protein ScmF [Candidatus Riflebacteria bacterium]|nr:SynChlorMet cassette radical SAM/SPASM protein ScmF [Candidatus Riflebacteria bacterium]